MPTQQLPVAEMRDGARNASPDTVAAPLRLVDVHKRWSRSTAPVLEGLELTLNPGELTWVGGRNGVGKTTMLRVAAGLIDPDRGRIEAWGLSPHRHRGRYQELVSFLPAGDRGLYARLSVRRQLEFWGRISMIPRARFPEAMERAVSDFALEELAERRVDRMSMGQRQRLRLAMTFLAEPEVVLLDEPLTSLDDEGAELLEGALRRVTASGGTILWCSPSRESLSLPVHAEWTLVNGKLERS